MRGTNVLAYRVPISSNVLQNSPHGVYGYTVVVKSDVFLRVMLEF